MWKLLGIFVILLILVIPTFPKQKQLLLSDLNFQAKINHMLRHSCIRIEESSCITDHINAMISKRN